MCTVTLINITSSLTYFGSSRIERGANFVKPLSESSSLVGLENVSSSAGLKERLISSFLLSWSTSVRLTLCSQMANGGQGHTQLTYNHIPNCYQWSHYTIWQCHLVVFIAKGTTYMLNNDESIAENIPSGKWVSWVFLMDLRVMSCW